MFIYNSYSLYISNTSFSYSRLPELQDATSMDGKSQALDASSPNTSNTTDVSTLPAMLPASKEYSPIASPETDQNSNRASTLMFEQLRIVAEKKVGIDNAEFRVRENYGHRVARRRALRRNMARFLKHLMRKLGRELRHFIKNADLSEEQESRLRDAFKEFKEGLKDIMQSLRSGDDLEPSEIKQALEDTLSSFVNAIENALVPEEQPDGEETEGVKHADQVPIKQEPIPIVAYGSEEKSQIETFMVNISSSKEDSTAAPATEKSEAQNANLSALLDGLRNSIEKVFDKTMRKISKMLDKLSTDLPSRAIRSQWKSWSIEIDYISIYQANSAKESSSEPAPSASTEERPMLYA